MLQKRLYHIDLLRFLAALYVLFYHYCFRGYSKDNLSFVRFEPLEEISKYGYLGVDLFFMISGFVILMTTLNSNLTKFMISRFSRLYPAYWVCLFITVTVLFFWGDPAKILSVKEILLNLTMFHGFFGIPHVDGVYWSLIIELKFYILIGFILLFNLIKYIRIFAIVLLGIAALQLVVPFDKAYLPLKLLYFISFPQWSSYFVAGMFFFLIYKEGFKRKYFIALICCYLISLQYAFVKVEHYIETYSHQFSYVTVSLFITTFYALFYLISVEKLHFINKKYFLTLGIITYPLYLIHQNIGYTILNRFSPYLNKWILLVALISLMIVLSIFIHKIIEKPLGIFFRNKLKESRFILHFQSKLNTIYTKVI